MSDPQLPKLLLDGCVGVIATDTIYGLACLASNPQSVARLYDLKNREKKPGTFIAASTGQLLELGLQEDALRAVEYLWPNPISIVMPTKETGTYLDLGKDSLAVRIPNEPTLLELLKKTGPLATSSVNLSGQPAATTYQEALNYFADRVDFYVDVGDLSHRPASTIVRFTKDGGFEILRQGAVRIDDRGKIIA